MNFIWSLLLLLIPSSVQHSETKVIIWNVGQGQFITLIHEEKCHHFDAGGERFYSTKKLLHLCQNKKNELNLTHWDQDHISFARLIASKIPRFCLQHYPKYDFRSLKKLNIKICTTRSNLPYSLIHPELIWEAKIKQNNDHSIIYSLLGAVLIPGDSTRRLEKLWVTALKTPETIHTLVAGHHGSYTSTSASLLRALPNLKMVIVSARKKKYGHPHIKTKKNLKTISRLRLFSTEQFGNIVIAF